MTIDHSRFKRVLNRCVEVANEHDVKAIVKSVFEDRLKEPAGVYLTAYQLLVNREGEANKENREALQAAAEIDRPYRVTRAALAAYQSNLKLPDTLKALTTDTDRVGAVESLLDRLEELNAQPWAAELLAGEFGTLAPKAIRETQEAISANKAVAAARDERAQAYGLAYERYLAFKRVVREACGSTSKQYKRIHLRMAGVLEGDEPAPAPTPEPPKTV